MTKIAKGTVILEIQPYNFNWGSTPEASRTAPEPEAFVVWVRRLVIQSLGKKMGTATFAAQGGFVQYRIRPEMIGVTLFAEADMTEEKIAAVAAGFKAQTLAFMKNKLNYPDVYTADSIRKGIDRSAPKPVVLRDERAQGCPPCPLT